MKSGLRDTKMLLPFCLEGDKSILISTEAAKAASFYRGTMEKA